MSAENRTRILVVDDDDLVRMMLQGTLEARHDVEGTPDGESALALIESQPWDLVILDVEMPGLDGYETCRRLRATPAGQELPVIFHSARTQIEERLKGYEAGGDDFLVKPFEPSELQVKIEKVLGQRLRQKDMAGQLDDMMNAVLSSADMVGEAGVVLDFQRQMAQCDDLRSLAVAILESLGRFGLDGCVRLSATGLQISLNAKGECSALENSILDHLQVMREGPRIRPLGPHTGFGYGQVLVFVRGLLMNRPDTMDRQESERMGRHIDNVALLVEGAMTRLSALEAQWARSQLASTQELVQLTRDALTDISARNHTQRLQVLGVFERLSSHVENAFLSLGLTAGQEDHLSEIIAEHRGKVMEILDASQVVERELGQVIQRLSPNPA